MIRRTRDVARDDAAISKLVQVGELLFLSGQVADQTRGGGVTAQTTEVLNLIEEILEDAGSSRRHILHATIHLSPNASFDAVNTAWNKFIERNHAPARTTVEAALYAPGCDVEITVIAVRDHSECQAI